MPRQRFAKTSFTAGEIAPELLGRHDLKGYANGAAELRNVIVLPTGGVRRRPGLRHVDTLPGAARLVPFAFNTAQTYLLVFTHEAMRVYRDDVLQATVTTPWTSAQLAALSWTQNADTLIVCHPDVPPQRITRTAHTAWTVTAFAFRTAGTDQPIRQPWFKFADPAVTLQSAGGSGTFGVTASAAVFVAGHVGTRFRLEGKEVKVTAVADATHATIQTIETVVTTPTANWEEQAFSAVRGWPVSAAFHQSRLCFGGSRDLPNRVWLSVIDEIDNFNLGTGQDDEAIEFSLLADQVNAVRALHAGRHLQVFTAGAEWMVLGEPLTPAKVEARRQTRLGSPAATRNVPPVDVDGATLFVGRDGASLYEFLYTDADQAYAATDLALLAKHLLRTPVDQDYDARSRLLYVVMADGTMAALTVYRAEQVSAWTALSTAGQFRTVAVAGEAAYVTVERAATLRLERFDDACFTDACLGGDDGGAVWAPLDHLDGMTVRARGDAKDLGDFPVVAGAVTLPYAVGVAEIGLPFSHAITPLPLATDAEAGGQGAPLRLIRLRLRLHATAALNVDVGLGLQAQPFAAPSLDAAPQAFSGDRELRGLGWRRGPEAALWRIEQDAAQPFTLLAALMEVKGVE